jgi:hypothetical protein
MVGGSSLGTPASSTTKTGHHDIVEILLKVALNTINQIKPGEQHCYKECFNLEHYT